MAPIPFLPPRTARGPRPRRARPRGRRTSLPRRRSGRRAGKAPGSSARVEVPDVELVDQDGKPVRVRSLLQSGKPVVVSFVFTTCTTVCPMISTIVARVQDQLGDRAGRDVALVSITVDPGRDTPARLKAYATRHHAGPGWTWLTGGRGAVEQVLRGMGAYTPNFADHPPMVLVGDGNRRLDAPERLPRPGGHRRPGPRLRGDLTHGPPILLAALLAALRRAAPAAEPSRSGRPCLPRGPGPRLLHRLGPPRPGRPRGPVLLRRPGGERRGGELHLHPRAPTPARFSPAG